MGLVKRIAKHARLNWQSLGVPDVPSPPFVILFINSICNMKCEHCFYWQNLNRPDDLSFDEMVNLSQQLGQIENLNLSGGEPLCAKTSARSAVSSFGCERVKEIYVPSNGYYTGKQFSKFARRCK
ncbi:MAG: radical SAM protein [Pyrinomonadaceae bacterium]